MEINRVWAMPNQWTFKIKPIRELLEKYHVNSGWVDPFAGWNSPAEFTNDIEGRCAKSQMDGYEFLCSLEDNKYEGGLFDPPYSVEMCLRKYTPKYAGTAGKSEYWAKCKNELSRIIKSGGLSIHFGWGSSALGMKRGFKIIEILLVPHGGSHNDTIVTVEQKSTLYGEK